MNRPALHKTIAILGAGLQGVTAALCLAERGHRIILIERESEALQKASLWNEGKIHLGFLFANDDACRTVDKMIEGADAFCRVLSRFITKQDLMTPVSRPFVYAVPKDSLLPVDEIEAHFEKVSARLSARGFADGRYFGTDATQSAQRLNTEEFAPQFADTEILVAFQTPELSVDTFRIAHALRNAIDDHPKIEVWTNTIVEGASPATRGRQQVRYLLPNSTSPETLTADIVINALWTDRLRVDAGHGLVPGGPFSFRYKLAVHASGADIPQKLHSTTMMLGSYGDLVCFDDGRMYLSWYPSCLQNSSGQIQPPRWEQDVTGEIRDEVYDDVLRELTQRIPALAGVRLDRQNCQIEGGTIFSWGSGRISDLDDAVHQRCDIGISWRGSYFSIDTGKYGMAPAFADDLTRLIGGK